MSDLISRQAALACFHAWVDKHGDVCAPDDMPEYRAIEKLPSAEPEKVCIANITLSEEQLREAVEKAKNGIIQALPSAEPERKTGKWIPCSERLPEDDVEVFIYLFERSAPYIAWVEDCRWYTEDFEVKKENYPTAWLPLPEPYREEQP